MNPRLQFCLRRAPGMGPMPHNCCSSNRAICAGPWPVSAQRRPLKPRHETRKASKTMEDRVKHNLRITAAGLATILAVGLAGCGEEKKEEQASQPAQESSTQTASTAPATTPAPAPAAAPAS